MKVKNREYNFKVLNNFLLIIFFVLYFFLALGKCYNYDEAYTIGMIENTYGEILNITSRDVHSPVYYWLLKSFCKLPIGNVFVLSKLFSMIFMIAFLFIGRHICRKYYSSEIECYWLLCAAWLPAMVLQSTNTRMYTMALFVMTVCQWLAYELFHNQSKLKWIAFTFITILCIYLHTFCMLEMVLIYIVLFICGIRKKNFRLIRNLIISGVTVSLCYIPWLIILFHQFSRWAGWETGWSNTISEFGLRSLFDYTAEWFSNLEDPHILAILFGMILYGITGIYTIQYVKRKRDYKPVLGVSIIVITVLLSVGVSVLIVPCFLGRYVFPLFGSAILMIAVGMKEIKSRYLKAVLIAGVFVFGMQAYIDEWKLEQEAGLNDYLTCMEEEYLTSHVIMADTYFSMTLSIYDPEKEYMIWGSAPECLPFKKYEVFKDWKQLEGVETVWLLSMEDFRVADISEFFEMKKSIRIPYSYYNFVLERYDRK